MLRYTGYSFERLFPDVLFPAESTDTNRLRGKIDCSILAGLEGRLKFACLSKFGSESSPRPALQNARDRPREAHQRRRGAHAPLHQRVVRRERSERGTRSHLNVQSTGKEVASDVVYPLHLQPPPGAWDHTVDEREHTVEQWKELIYQVEIELNLVTSRTVLQLVSFTLGSH